MLSLDVNVAIKRSVHVFDVHDSISSFLIVTSIAFWRVTP
jgi:hypothetical protein